MSILKQYYQNYRPEMLALLPTGYRKILEIGCGEGNFSAQLRAGTETWGVEMDAASAAVARTKLTKVMVGTYWKVANRIPDNTFDLVVCNDVIEHVEEHERFLESIRAKLSNGGYLVASIPNVRHIRNLYELLLLKDWEYRDHGILDSTHLRFFTQKSVRKMLERHGFDIEELRGVNRSPSLLPRLLGVITVVLTLGYFSDVPYMQIAVRGRKRQ